MDTTKLEMIAEDLISHKLQRHGILVAKPKFDRSGSDLLAMASVDDDARFCRIQCKGRSLYTSESRTSVEIRNDYITDSFVVFLYVDNDDYVAHHLFCFFSDDLRKAPWKTTQNGMSVALRLSGRTFLEKLRNHVFTDSTIERVKAVIASADVREEMKRLDHRRFSGTQLAQTIGALLEFVKRHDNSPLSPLDRSQFASINGKFRNLRDVLGLRVPPPRPRRRPFDCDVQVTEVGEVVTVSNSAKWRAKMYSLRASAEWMAKSTMMSKQELAQGLVATLDEVVEYVGKNEGAVVDDEGLREFAELDGRLHAIRVALAAGRCQHLDIDKTLGDSQVEFVDQDANVKLLCTEGWKIQMQTLRSSVESMVN